MRSFYCVLIGLILLSTGLFAKAPTTAEKAALYLDKLGKDVLTDLQKIAMSPEAQKGDWQGIKPQLSKLNDKLPAVYFWVLPDGNYYSVEKDFTNLNLSNRPYFKPLFSGKDIWGEPIYSRSTGKKSAVFATPIRSKGKINGALGASIFLDELHSRLNKTFAFPKDYTWFAINSEGLNMLDMEAEYIFMDLKTEFTPSVQQAVSTILKNKKGEVEYQIGNVKRQASFHKIPKLNWWMVVAKRESANLPENDKMQLSLERFVPVLQSSLDTMYQNTLTALQTANPDWSDESSIRTFLNEQLNRFPAVVEVAFIAKPGILKYIEPPEYKNLEGTDISNQEHIIRFFAEPKNSFSECFPSVEGYQAAVISYPVYNSQKELQGALHLLIRPELLIQALIKDMALPEGYELCILQNDGTTVYDADAEEVGKNLFTDPIYAGYENLHALGRKVVASPQGSGDFVYQAVGHVGKISKTAVWDMVSLLGTQWKVVIIKPEGR